MPPVWAHLASVEEVVGLIRHTATVNGLDAQSIAEFLNTRFRTTLFTRNMVAGMASREGIPMPSRWARKRGLSKLKTAPRSKTDAEPYEPPDGAVHTLHVKDGQCRYITFPGIKGKITYDRAWMCGQPTKPGSSWCQHHHDICHEDAEPPKARRARTDDRRKALLSWMKN